MKPIFSDESRNLVVKNFISAIYNSQSKIASYKAITPHLQQKRVKILNGMSPNMHEEPDDDGNWGSVYYDDRQSEEYFNWLIDVVTGGVKATDTMRANANNQLFIFIRVLIDADSVVAKEKPQLVMPHWEDKLTSFDEKIDQFQKELDSRDEEITRILTAIYNWMKENQPMLDEVKREAEGQLGKVKNGKP